MRIEDVKLRARMSKNGDRILCGMARCGGILGYADRRDNRQLKRDRPDLADVLPDETAALFTGSGFMPEPDGSWRHNQYAQKRVERGLSPRDSHQHAIAKQLPYIVSGKASPEEHAAFRDQIRRREGIPVDRMLRAKTVIYCPNPKCQRPNLVDPEALLTPPRATR